MLGWTELIARLSSFLFLSLLPFSLIYLGYIFYHRLKMSVNLQVPDWRGPATAAPALIPSSNTPSAKTSSSTKEKRLKLRASCDACAASKIRCSKEHPTCARCSANKSQCIYGVSRKHGKPGRKRKRNPDGTPFVKAVKNRPSATTNQASKPGLPTIPQLQVPQVGTDIAQDWVSDWSPTSSLPDASVYDFKTTSGPMYTDFDCFNTNCTDNGSSQMMQPQPEQCQPVDSSFISYDSYMKNQWIQLDSSNMQAPDDYSTSNMMAPRNYPTIDIATMPPFEPLSSPSQSTMYSPANQALRNSRPIMTSSLSIPPHHSNYGYNLANSTFDNSFSWSGPVLPSPVSDSVCSSSPSTAGIVSPFAMLDTQHDVASNLHMQPWEFSGYGFHGGSADMGRTWSSQRLYDMR